MGKATGQMQEDTQELLDHFNSHYNWDYNDMCRFIDNHTEQESKSIMKHIKVFAETMVQS